MASETITTMETEQTTIETEQTKEISKVVYFKLRLPASADNKKTFPRLNDLCKQHGDAYSLFYNGYTQAIQEKFNWRNHAPLSKPGPC